jgi:hypothetical protein
MAMWSLKPGLVRSRVSVIEPVPNSTKLRVSDAGLQVLRKMPGLLAPVVVIGPYRSGKSFLINQMLQIPCGMRLASCKWLTVWALGFWVACLTQKHDVAHSA